jgi:hypothetical protein
VFELVNSSGTYSEVVLHSFTGSPDGQLPNGGLVGDAPPIPDGYFDTGLSFNLNYNRPSYFGFEAMPFVEQVAARFGLTVLDPQAGGDGLELITDANSKTLVQSWLNHNQRATLALIQDSDFSNPLRMSAAASLYLWRYKKAKENLEEKCGEEVFVPDLVPVRRKGDSRVGRAFTYTQGLPMIVPESEWVFIVGAKKGFFRAKEKQEVAVISAEIFRELPPGYIQPFQWPDPSVRIIGPGSAEGVGKIIFSIDRTMSRSEFDVIGTDSFVDIELPNGK